MKDFLTRFFKKRKRHVLYTCFLIGLAILLSGTLVDLVLKYYVSKVQVKELPFSVKTAEYPALNSPIDLNNISAKAVVVMDKDSKVVLSSKNPNLVFSLASTTKIMTALVSLDYYKMDDVLTIKTEGVEGVNVGFEEGEKVFFKDMLYAMLLPSGNDAALAIAENYPGGKKAFIQKMNEKVKLFRLDNTNFGDSIGLEDSHDYTTPVDLARLSSIALGNEVIAKIVSTKSWEITDITGEKKYLLTNLNRLLGYRGVNGVKTGYTIEAGQVLVTSKDEQGHTLIVVVMGSQDRFADTLVLLNQISGNVNYLSIYP